MKGLTFVCLMHQLFHPLNNKCFFVLPILHFPRNSDKDEGSFLLLPPKIHNIQDTILGGERCVNHLSVNDIEVEVVYWEVDI